jgi:hypothetical protein
MVFDRVFDRVFNRVFTGYFTGYLQGILQSMVLLKKTAFRPFLDDHVPQFSFLIQ